ncbi:MAG: shikimate kinase [Treponema sp.]|jgi:shikimate kinase|nr:shikimate kinase [Treponema sp.]
MEDIILTGPKHSGKTTVGKELAALTDAPFFDLDDLVETAAKKSVRELYGESPALFCRHESGALLAFLETQHGVLAAGGGIIDNAAAVNLLRRASGATAIICIDVPVQCAWHRIASRTLPVFLQAASLEESREKHRVLHENRMERYRRLARFTVSGKNKTAREIAQAIADLLHIKSG